MYVLGMRAWVCSGSLTTKCDVCVFLWLSPDAGGTFSINGSTCMSTSGLVMSEGVLLNSFVCDTKVDFFSEWGRRKPY